MHTCNYVIGVSDIVMGAPTYSTTMYGDQSGMVHVIYGQSGTSRDDVYVSEYSGYAVYGPLGSSNGYGTAVTIGDVNGDGYNELIIHGCNSGQIHVLYGSASPQSNDMYIDAYENQFIIYTKLDNTAGSYVVDVNRDGIKDILVPNTNIYNDGVGYVVYGTAGRHDDENIQGYGVDLEPQHGMVIDSESMYTGGTIATSMIAADFNLDGYVDIVVGSADATPLYTYSNRNYAGIVDIISRVGK